MVLGDSLSSHAKNDTFRKFCHCSFECHQVSLEYTNGIVTIMKLFYKGKDGGPQSPVTGFWLVEIKSLFSAALLRFGDGSRDEFHSHAFDSISWVLKGMLVEQHLNCGLEHHQPSFKPVITRRGTFHRVLSRGTTWVITFRGPWTKNWKEFHPVKREFTTLTNGRLIVHTSQCEP